MQPTDPPRPRSLRARLTGTPESESAPVPRLLPQRPGQHVNVLPDSHPWKREMDRFHTQNHQRVRPMNKNRSRMELRLEAHIRGQLNDLIEQQNVSGAEIIRRAVAEYHWRYVLGRALPPLDDYAALDVGDD